MNRHIHFEGTDIFIESLNFDIESIASICNDAILNKINSASSPRRKREIAMSHILINQHISKEDQLCHHSNGAPFIKGNDCFISISHSATEIALAINHTHPIGIDIENWRDQLLRVRNRFLSHEEMRIYTSHQQLLQAWTAKEALYKIANTPGISFADDIRLPLFNDDHHAIVNTPHSISKFAIHYLDSSSSQCLTLVTPL